MRRLHFVFIGFLACLSFILPAYALSEKTQAIPVVSPVSAPPEKVFNAEGFTLENGMQVVVIPNDRAPVVTSMVWIKAGSADEPWGRSGSAHFFEHLMFKGTPSVGPGEFSKTVRALGGNDNAFTSYDYTAYFETVSVEHLEKIMAMDADRMQNLAPPPDHFDSERKVILEERRERTDNDPAAKFGEQLRAALYVNHPYGRPVIGWLSEMEKLNWTTAKKFYDKFYAPNNAILVVSGDMTAERLRPLVEKTYGALPPLKKAPSRKRPEVPPLMGAQLLTYRDPAIRQPVLQRLYRVPSWRQSKQESLALEVLEEILSGGPSTRLYKALAVDSKKVSSVSFSYDAQRWDHSESRFSAAALPGVKLEEIDAAIDAVLRALIKTGVHADELRAAKDSLKDGAVYARDSLTGPAMIVGQALATGASLEDVETWPAQIESVTAAQVQDVAKKYFNPDDPFLPMHVTGYLMPVPGEVK
ncbi:MAG: insulinase family protein [Rhodospirillales bacterium]|nr:insulinase family protein [Rhodospirillales bacterium]